MKDELLRRIRQLSAGDALWLGVVTIYGVLVVLPWWSTTILPLMDYPMLLSFVRILQDYDDASSPMYGVYSLGPPISPLVLPLLVTGVLSKLGSIELGGRLLWTAYAIALPLSAYFLTRTLRLSQWNVVWVFPLVFSKWVSSGFFGFTTGLPLVLLCYGLAIRWLHRSTRTHGAALSFSILGVTLWHALLMAQTLLGVFIIWLCWRAPSAGKRWTVLWPALPGVALFVGWFISVFTAPRPVSGSAPKFVYSTLAESLNTELFFSRLLMLYPGAEVFAKLLVFVGITMLVLGPREAQKLEPDAPTQGWRKTNPIAIVAWVSVGCFFALPAHALGVEVVSQRFGWVGVVLAGVAWRWPAHRRLKTVAVCAVVGLGMGYVTDVRQRFQAFHQETAGASRLIDSIPPHASLIAPISNLETKSFRNKPIREIQQYATVRKGGLPTTSFAGYSVNYVRYAGEKPRPELFARNFLAHPRLPEFDFVLLQRPHPAAERSRRLRLLREDGGWRLFAICGSRAHPSCEP